MPPIDGDADARASVGPIALTVPSAIDVNIDSGALPAAARTLLTGAHIGAPITLIAALIALILRGATAAALVLLGSALSTVLSLCPWRGILALSPWCVIALLCFVHEPMGTVCADPRRERRDLVSTYKRERRDCGTQHQQVSHGNHPCSAFRLPRFRSLPQQRLAEKEVAIRSTIAALRASTTLAAKNAG